jgi:hypothetical protein
MANRFNCCCGCKSIGYRFGSTSFRPTRIISFYQEEAWFVDSVTRTLTTESKLPGSDATFTRSPLGLPVETSSTRSIFSGSDNRSLYDRIYRQDGPTTTTYGNRGQVTVLSGSVNADAYVIRYEEDSIETRHYREGTRKLAVEFDVSGFPLLGVDPYYGDRLHLDSVSISFAHLDAKLVWDATWPTTASHWDTLHASAAAIDPSIALTSPPVNANTSNVVLLVSRSRVDPGESYAAAGTISITVRQAGTGNLPSGVKERSWEDAWSIEPDGSITMVQPLPAECEIHLPTGFNQYDLFQPGVLQTFELLQRQSDGSDTVLADLTIEIETFDDDVRHYFSQLQFAELPLPLVNVQPSTSGPPNLVPYKYANLKFSGSMVSAGLHRVLIPRILNVILAESVPDVEAILESEHGQTPGTLAIGDLVIRIRADAIEVGPDVIVESVPAEPLEVWETTDDTTWPSPRYRDRPAVELLPEPYLRGNGFGQSDQWEFGPKHFDDLHTKELRLRIRQFPYGSDNAIAITALRNDALQTQSKCPYGTCAHQAHHTHIDWEVSPLSIPDLTFTDPHRRDYQACGVRVVHGPIGHVGPTPFDLPTITVNGQVVDLSWVGTAPIEINRKVTLDYTISLLQPAAGLIANIRGQSNSSLYATLVNNGLAPDASLIVESTDAITRTAVYQTTHRWNVNRGELIRYIGQFEPDEKASRLTASDVDQVVAMVGSLAYFYRVESDLFKIDASGEASADVSEFVPAATKKLLDFDLTLLFDGFFGYGPGEFAPYYPTLGLASSAFYGTWEPFEEQGNIYFNTAGGVIHPFYATGLNAGLLVHSGYHTVPVNFRWQRFIESWDPDEDVSFEMATNSAECFFASRDYIDRIDFPPDPAAVSAGFALVAKQLPDFTITLTPKRWNNLN